MSTTRFKFIATLGIAIVAMGTTFAQTKRHTLPASGEMLSNGTFEAGTHNWVLEMAEGAKGVMTKAKFDPDGKPAIKVKVLNIGEQPWQIQLHQAPMKIDKGRKYTLTYWAKADRVTLMTVNCMQNHAPWEHHGAALETKIGTEWKPQAFSFVGPWDDSNARITFTNLGNVVGQEYWFANCSLKAGPATSIPKAEVVPDQNAIPAKRIVVWDGESAKSFGGWANPPTSHYTPKKGDAHSGDTALEFSFNDEKIWIGCGFHWLGWRNGTDVGTDTRQMTRLTFWIKSIGTTGDLDAQLLCNGDILDTPEHHSGKVKIAKYCPNFRDGKWHEVAIPLTDLTQPLGFDPRIVSQLDLGFKPEGKAQGSFLIDDIAFDNRRNAKQRAIQQ